MCVLGMCSNAATGAMQQQNILIAFDGETDKLDVRNAVGCNQNLAMKLDSNQLRRFNAWGLKWCKVCVCLKRSASKMIAAQAL